MIDAACKQAFMKKSRDKYYMEMLRTITYFNNRNNEPLLNENIQEAKHKVIII